MSNTTLFPVILKMETVRIVRALFYCLILNSISGFELSPATLKRNAKLCAELGKEPYFDIDQIVGKPWRIYYTWDLQMLNKCVDMVFKNASIPIINRIYNDMYEYMETQPNWDAATMLMDTVGKAKHEILMFANQGAAGSFDAVPNMISGGNLKPMRGAVPILKFFIKLVHEGRYLLLVDCNIGVASLSARGSPARAEAAGVAAACGLGEGFPACTTTKNRNEQIYYTK